jgi:hypothetical protein
MADLNKAPPAARVVFGVAPDPHGGVPLVLLGVPSAAWDYMKDGKTHTFDLTAIGVPLKLIMFGAKDRDEAVRLLEEGNKRAGLSSLHDRRDFGIKS